MVKLVNVAPENENCSLRTDVEANSAAEPAQQFSRVRRLHRTQPAGNKTVEHRGRTAVHLRAIEKFGIAADDDKCEAVCLLGVAAKHPEKLVDMGDGGLSAGALEEEIVLVENDAEWPARLLQRDS